MAAHDRLRAECRERRDGRHRRKTYTFQTTLTNTDGHVKIGASGTASLANLVAAITLGAGSGSTYAAATTLHASVTAASTGLVLTASAKTIGTTFAVSATLAQGSWAPDPTYLTLASGNDNDGFVATTINDDTFIANKQIAPALAATVAPTRPKEALFFFRAGNYLATYQLAIIYGGKIYVWTYTTPDNSVAANAKYIGTTQLAATFYRALRNGTAATVTATNTSVGSAPYGVGPQSVGDPGGSGAGTISVVTTGIDITALGFSITLSGNVIRVWRADGNDFDVDVADSAGNSNLMVVKDTVQFFTDLPQIGVDGFTVKVRGESKTAVDDYYVQFNATSTDGGKGNWQEVVKPGVQTTLDPTTMPHMLFNTGYRAFSFGRAIWGPRVSGDGVNSAKTPSFVGELIQDLFYDNNRLAIMVEGSTVWSKTNNAFVFFPDTAQTVLATDPIDFNVAAKRQIALLRQAVQQGDGTFLWAQRVQISVSSGTDSFKAENIRMKATTAYEFTEQARPVGVAQSLLFATERGRVDDHPRSAHSGRQATGRHRHFAARAEVHPEAGAAPDGQRHDE